MTPYEDVARAIEAHRRLEAAVGGLDDDDVRRPSLLPGWTVGHLLTHIARNADSVRRRTEGAARNEVVDQYAGGPAGRAAEIEAGADRRARELIDDIHTSDGALEAVWDALPEPAWSGLSRDVSGRERPVHELPRLRWYEVEVHLVDVGGGVGLTPDDWPAHFVDRRLPELRAGLPGRLPPGAQPPAQGALTPHQELAWLYGRLRRDDLPDLSPWA
ncbi:MAG TPA: maleylpyruvate isomerase N-terminal domain-containing protein [Acidimicrobiia bacterium]|nr:maleylpyruvate isomerase N-terminal domain-containing protein [Acidimicrobiia bacterium]